MVSAKKLTRKMAAAAAAGVAATLMLTACQAEKPDAQGWDSGQVTNWAIDEPVTEADVLKAVTAATTLKDLPTKVRKSDLVAASGDDQKAWALPRCTPTIEQTKLDDLGPCTLGDLKSEREIFVVGDSAAAMWYGAFDLIGKRKAWKVVMLTKNNCGPATLTYYQWQRGRTFTECTEWQKWRAGVIEREQPGIVVLAGWYGGNLGPGKKETPQVWRDGLVKTATQFPKNTKVVMLGNTPHPATPPAECVASNPSNLVECASDPEQAVPDQTGWSRAAKDVGGTFIDVTPWFCADSCPAIIGDQIVYAGKNHITQKYGRYVSGSIEKAMAPLLGA
ncbi:hypothetical protein M2359_003007 [Gordonia amarae]|uniref:SGNH hydrolase domain-containing protein n=1 Tax=Gordonia amarae TaxID=36821 RepID=UPI0003151E4D|nr:SGNH hydrolase domain-containing protein [Gordonia amarae]MCS3879378.1 hypothetical protein [Gordonia amarae]